MPFPRRFRCRALRATPAFSIVLAVAPLVAAAAAPAAAAPPPSFNRDIRPILSRCIACHGPDAAARAANLRLDDREDAIRDRRGGATIVPGDPDASTLLERITSHDPDLVMPPPGAGEPVSAEERATLRAWIAAGATYQTHWAWIAPDRDATTPDAGGAWARHDLDRFVAARHAELGLSPAPEADLATLARRASLDLTGLPPTLDELDVLLADESPDAYERFVDRLLDSPAFGERWARVWLDVARYADTKGYEADRRRTMWPWRDWVIRAFNADMPYDRFTIAQLAGDLLPGGTDDDVLATAFHRNTMTNDEGGTRDEEYRMAAVIDRTNTTLGAWMGLTAECSVCHDHKYDPLTSPEYYQVLAFLNTTQDADRNDEQPLLHWLAAEDRAARAARLRDREALDPAAEATTERVAEIDREIAAIDARAIAVPVLREQPADQRRTTHVLGKGDWRSPEAPVEPGVPSFLHPLPSDAAATPDRLALARWIVDDRNPLTARVHVNRVWERLFGLGLVETQEDFGTQGTPPSNQPLLDHLAVRFMDDFGWSHKALCREIATSATYRQWSATTPQTLAADPRNEHLARGPRFRLEAEAIRDAALVASGRLSRTMHGPPVFPPQPDGVWQVVYSGDAWTTAENEDRYRRSLYTFWRRTSPHPAMTTLDAGSRETCAVRRIRTNTPLQALVLLNDETSIEAAGGLALRMSGTTPSIDEAIILGFRLATARTPEPDEIAVLRDLYDRTLVGYRSSPESAAALLESARVTAPENGDAPELAARIVLANVLLNLDEFVTRG